MPDQVSGPVATHATSGSGSLDAGRWFVRTGYTVLFGAIAMAVVESVLAWGKTSSATLLVCTLVLWLASGMIAYGRKLRGELPVISPLSAIFGRECPIVDTARELFGGIELAPMTPPGASIGRTAQTGKRRRRMAPALDEG